jgi:putative ABC transport system permease protein
MVLPFATWATVHGRDPAIVGKAIPLDGRSHEVIGVLAEEFIAPDAVVTSPDYWVPRSLDPNARGTYGALAIGRLAPGSSVTAADADVRGIIEQAYAEEGASFVIGAKVRDLRVATIGDVGSTLWVLMGGVALLLAIGCMNVANLMLVRSSDRSGEVALRTAMGATRQRIARQLVTESVVVALVGGAIGALLAHLLVSAFLAWGPGGVPRLAEVSLDGRALAFAFMVAALTGIGFGLFPAIRSTHVAPARALVSGRHSASARVGRLRSGLVVAETAMALVLVLAAGLLVNSFVRMRTVDPGFEVDGLVTARLELRTGYEESSSWLLFWDRVLEATRAIPGVRNAAISAFVPFLDFPLVQSYTPEGHDIPPDESVFIVSVPTTADFAETLGLRIVQGRDFDGTERAGGEEVILVSETLARTYWPGESSVIGRRIKSGSLNTEDEGWFTVIGVMADARHNLADPPAEIVYHPLQQQPWRQLSILARTYGPEGPVLDALRDAIRSIDPGLPVRSFGTLETLASESVVQPRFYSGLAAGFGALALVLALVGIYGTAAYATSRRAREIGIRIALGAEKRTVLSMLTFEAARLALFGIGLGVPAAIASMRLLEGHLFGITPTDPATFIVVSAAVALTASLAAWLPARRAAGLDPMTTLRRDV